MQPVRVRAQSLTSRIEMQSVAFVGNYTENKHNQGPNVVGIRTFHFLASLNLSQMIWSPPRLTYPRKWNSSTHILTGRLVISMAATLVILSGCR